MSKKEIDESHRTSDKKDNQMKFLRIDKLSKNFGKIEALRAVSLRIPKGTSYALLGPNGSGKTTLLKALVGSLHYDSGSIHIGGLTDVQLPAYKRQMTYMPQHPGFLPHLTAKESIELLIKLRGQPAIFQEKLVSDLGIEKFWKKPFGELSGGMKQKINILQCFMFASETIFLDEPTSSLDPQMTGYVKSLVREAKANGKTILFTSHIMSEVEDIADRMALLNNGSVLLEASPKEFIQEQKASNLEEAMSQFWREHGV